MGVFGGPRGREGGTEKEKSHAVARENIKLNEREKRSIVSQLLEKKKL